MASAVHAGQDLPDDALQLADLVPGGQAERDSLHARPAEAAEALRAFLRIAEGGPGLDARPRVVGRVVKIEKSLRLGERRLAILVHVDVVVVAVAEPVGIPPLLARVPPDRLPVLREDLGGEAVRLPSVGEPRDAPEGPLDARGLRPDRPRIVGEPDGAGLLEGLRLERHVLELEEPTAVRHPVLAPEAAKDRDVLLEPSLALGHRHADRPRLC